MLVEPEKAKASEYVLVRSRTTDRVYVVKSAHWADYKWEVRNPDLEVVVSGERGYLTLLEQLTNDEDESTKEHR